MKYAVCTPKWQIRKAAHLYGVLKLHKTPVGVRWIAGSSMQYVTRTKKIPTTSIAQSAGALGGILREIMSILRAKDVAEFLRTGVRRYWMVSSAEEVAEQLKNTDARLQGRLLTRDFMAMYTSLPLDLVLKQCVIPCQEAYEWFATTTKCPMAEVGIDVKYDSAIKAFGTFKRNGYAGKRS